MNLLHEITEELEDRGYDFDDIEAIQGRKERISVKRFKELADLEYDDEYGPAKVATDLVILMKDGSWFSRWKYGESEGWRYNRRPQPLANIDDAAVQRLVGEYWPTLHDLN